MTTYLRIGLLPVVLKRTFHHLNRASCALEVYVEASELNIGLKEKTPALRILIQFLQQVVAFQVSPQVNWFLLKI